MVDITLIPQEEFQRVREARIDRYERLEILADMCRANTLAAVKRAGSGHLGSSFSAMDINIWLYMEAMNTLRMGFDHPDRDIFFSSKGHDVPGLYALFYALGIVSEEKLLGLRRYNGLHGHPDVSTPGIEANSGSLGMGLSKGRGIAWAKRHQGWGGHVFVMLGDGELQEGQNYEAFHSAVHQKIGGLTAIVDNNKVQSDMCVSEIMDLGDLETVFRANGWHVGRCDGHDFRALEATLNEFKQVTDKPKVLIADTIKGRGVSFMEHPVALESGKGLYRWHAGAPDDESYLKGYGEIVDRANARLAQHGLAPVQLKTVAPEVKEAPNLSLQGEPVSQLAEEKITSGVSDEYVAVAYGDALVEIGARRKDLVVLDADLSSDCKIRKFEYAYPERFIENGIAEMDMVSMAGGLARHGLLPVVNSFGTFLAARANEQIYNNTGEKTKIIYAVHYAGLIPAGPGKSHQSIRDISLFGALPFFSIIQPCNAAETRMALEYAVDGTPENTMLRFVIGPSPRKIQLPEGYTFTPGVGAALTGGDDAVMFAYGPVMLHEALIASEVLAERGFGLKVVNMPWLNKADGAWLRETVSAYKQIIVLEDHSPVGGLGDFLLTRLMEEELLDGRRLVKWGVEGLPAFGTPPQALRHHRLDGISLADRVLTQAGR